MKTKPNLSPAFKKDYDEIFSGNPEAANLFLLIYELADENGNCTLKGGDEELTVLFNKRFKKPREYQFSEHRHH